MLDFRYIPQNILIILLLLFCKASFLQKLRVSLDNRKGRLDIMRQSRDLLLLLLLLIPLLFQGFL